MRWTKFGQRAEKNMTNKKTSHDSDVSFIASLAQLLRDNDLTELQVKRDYGENDSLNVRVSRQIKTVMQAVSAPAGTTQTTSVTSAAVEVPNDPAAHPGAVPSPMVGTVYMAAEPGASAFVTVGTLVAEGDTILIIEAMKTMNHIPAPKAGKIKRILVEDGGAVEYGAPLVIIE